MGVLYVHYFEQRSFNPDQIARIQKLVQQASDGIRLSIERSEQREHWRHVSALRNLLSSSVHAGSQCTTLEDLACNASNLLGADAIGIFHRDSSEAGGGTFRLFEKIAGLLPSGFARDACAEIMSVDNGQGAFAPDVRVPEWLPGANAAHAMIERERMTSAAGLLLKTRAGRSIGALYVGFRGYRPFDVSETAVIKMLGTLISAVFEGRPPDGEEIVRAMDLVTPGRPAIEMLS